MIITKNLTIDWLIDWIIYLLLANVKWEDFQTYLWREYSCSKESVITMGGPRAESWMYRKKIYNGYWKCCLAKGHQRPKWCSFEIFAGCLLRSSSMISPRNDAFIYIVPQVFHMFRYSMWELVFYSRVETLPWLHYFTKWRGLGP